MVEAISDPVKPPVQPARPRWLLPVAAGALVLLGAGVALAVALPITMRRPLRSTAYEPLSPDKAAALAGIDRTYYVAADVVDWDYAPSGQNLCKGINFTEPEQLYAVKGAGRKYKKALFREYTDGSFQVGWWGGSRSCPSAALHPCWYQLLQQ